MEIKTTKEIIKKELLPHQTFYFRGKQNKQWISIESVKEWFLSELTDEKFDLSLTGASSYKLVFDDLLELLEKQNVK